MEEAQNGAQPCITMKRSSYNQFSQTIRREGETDKAKDIASRKDAISNYCAISNVLPTPSYFPPT